MLLILASISVTLASSVTYSFSYCVINPFTVTNVMALDSLAISFLCESISSINPDILSSSPSMIPLILCTSLVVLVVYSDNSNVSLTHFHTVGSST